MRLSNLISFAGFVILISGTYCPILHPIIGSWDVYDGSKPYGVAILLVAVVGIIGCVFGEKKLIRLMGWISLALVILLIILTWLKVHTSFNFIPLHFVARYLTSKLKFKWGWFLLFGGPSLALAGAVAPKTKISGD